MLYQNVFIFHVEMVSPFGHVMLVGHPVYFLHEYTIQNRYTTFLCHLNSKFKFCRLNLCKNKLFFLLPPHTGASVVFWLWKRDWMGVLCYSYSFCAGCHPMSRGYWHPFELAVASRGRFRWAFHKLRSYILQYTYILEEPGLSRILPAWVFIVR